HLSGHPIGGRSSNEGADIGLGTTACPTPVLEAATIAEEAKMRIKAGIIGAALIIAAVSSAQANLKVFACFPEWASLTRTLGGDRVEVFQAAPPDINPDYVQATPALIAAYSNADLAVCTGINFEEDWLPILQQKSGNAKLAPGKPGLFNASDYAK